MRTDRPKGRRWVRLRRQDVDDFLELPATVTPTTTSTSTTRRRERVGHGIQHRHRVLGLAWSNGKIELDASLESQSELAQKVFLSEVAHEVDWFDPAMNAAGEERLWDAMHPGIDLTTGDHGHSWFDVGAYETWVGESWMALFTAATSDVAVTLTQFTHKVTPEAITVARELLGVGSFLPPPAGPAPYFGAAGSRVFHDQHRRADRDVEWAARELAIAAGRRPCGVCRP